MPRWDGWRPEPNVLSALLVDLRLEPQVLLICLLAVFGAGLVRGFAGFALSALAMASIATIIPPVELIPICFFMELAASLLLLGGNVREADREVVVGLVVSAAAGVPLGLYATNNVDAETSKAVALVVVASLALLQLAKVKAPVLATRGGLWASGFASGIVTGLASVGGLVVALYVLARDAPPRQMRASLILYLFLSSPVGFALQIAYGMITPTALWRASLFTVFSTAGVLIGRRFFSPALEPFYKRFCLGLLVGLALWGLVRVLL